MKIALLAVPLALLSTVSAAQEGDASTTPPPIVDTPQPASSVRADASTETSVDDGRRLNRLTVGPLTVFAGAVTVEFERALTDKISVYGGPRVGFTGLGLGGSVGARFFPLEQGLAPNGLWVGPEVFAEYARQSGTLNNVRFASSGVKAFLLAMVGYTHTLDMGLTFTVGGGAGAGYAKSEGTTVTTSPTGQVTSTPVNTSGLAPSLAVNANIGWAF